jgi:hypothetical protein
MAFFTSIAGPLGVFVFGIATEKIGVFKVLTIMGSGFLILAPLLLIVPGFIIFIKSSTSEGKLFLKNKYPILQKEMAL